MLRFALQAMRLPPAARSGIRAAIYVTPWYRQAAGWFAIAFGIAMAVRTGVRVEFLLNDMPYPAIHPDELNEVAAFEAFCREVEALFPVRRLGAFAGAPEPSRRSIVERIVDAALAADIRHRTGVGVFPAANAEAYRRTARTPLSHLAAACDRFMATERPDLLFCPGGVANGSFVPKLLADAYGVRFASADSGLGTLLIASHGIAAHGLEAAETHGHIRRLGRDVQAMAADRGIAALAAKVAAARAETPTGACDLLLPLGYDYDTSALAVGSIYERQSDWLFDTIDFVSRNAPDVRMMVRQHPLEARYPCAENAQILAALEIRKPANLTISRAATQGPVYPLFETAKACVACQSTVMLEAALSGVPALSVRDTYFSAAVPRAESRTAYHDWLADHLRGTRRSPDPSVREAAAILYFIFSDCLSAPTRFTPHADDLWAWLAEDPAAALMSPELTDLVTAVADDLPITTLRARRLLGLPISPSNVPEVENAGTARPGRLT